MAGFISEELEHILSLSLPWTNKRADNPMLNLFSLLRIFSGRDDCELLWNRSVVQALGMDWIQDRILIEGMLVSFKNIQIVFVVY